MLQKSFWGGERKSGCQDSPARPSASAEPLFHQFSSQVTFLFAGTGSISAILRRQSASESWGPETKVPLTLVEYQPDTTPRRSDSSVLT